MIIRSNLPALNSHRNLSKNNSNLAQNLERLSSGFRINRAADDAAGLAISERMRGQIRGLAQAKQNVRMGVNLIQTADGALQETHAILQRMRELSVQAANGTFQDSDRAQIEHEFQALKDEIDRIAESTHYNNIRLLDGSLGSLPPRAAPPPSGEMPAPPSGLNVISGVVDLTGATITQDTIITGNVTVVGNLLVDPNVTIWVMEGATVSVTQDFRAPINVGGTSFGHGTTIHNSGTIEVDYLGVGTVINYRNGNLISRAIDADTIKNYGTINRPPTHTWLGSIAVNTLVNWGEILYHDVMMNSTAYNHGRLFHWAALQGSVLHNFGHIYEVEGQHDGTIENWGTIGIVSDSGPPYFQVLVTINERTIEFEIPFGLILQIGANGGRDQRMTIFIENMGARHIGAYSVLNGNFESVWDTTVITREQANDSIEILEGAINMVSAQRAKLGAYQNRLESTINSLGVAHENLTNAESTIRDTDMAAEMMRFTANNILTQAAQAMLAQANQLPQGVLQLLR